MFRIHDYVYVRYNGERYFARVTGVVPGGYNVLIQLQVGKRSKKQIEKEVIVPAADVSPISVQSAA